VDLKRCYRNIQNEDGVSHHCVFIFSAQNILPLSDEEADSSNDEWGGGLLRPLGKKHRSAKKCWIDDEECSAVTASVTREEADDEVTNELYFSLIRIQNFLLIASTKRCYKIR